MTRYWSDSPAHPRRFSWIYLAAAIAAVSIVLVCLVAVQR